MNNINLIVKNSIKIDSLMTRFVLISNDGELSIKYAMSKNQLNINKSEYCIIREN